MLTREEALELLREHVSGENLRKHAIATEAIMRALARRLGEDEELWGITGLVHDLDYERTADAPAEHTRQTCQILRQKGFPEEAISSG